MPDEHYSPLEPLLWSNIRQHEHLLQPQHIIRQCNFIQPPAPNRFIHMFIIIIFVSFTETLFCLHFSLFQSPYKTCSKAFNACKLLRTEAHSLFYLWWERDTELFHVSSPYSPSVSLGPNTNNKNAIQHPPLAFCLSMDIFSSTRNARMRRREGRVQAST